MRAENPIFSDLSSAFVETSPVNGENNYTKRGKRYINIILQMLIIIPPPRKLPAKHPAARGTAQ